jgi:hypothetical protein
MMPFALVCLLPLLAVGCSGAEVASNQSNPISALHQIGQSGVGEVSSNSAVAGPLELFDKGQPALPGPLRVIQFGMDPASARAGVEGVRDPEVPVFESSAGGADLLGGQLPMADGVGFTVIIRESKVVEIDVSIPAEGARKHLAGLWGPGQEAVVDGLRSIVWRDEASGLEARLFEADEDKSVVKFLKQAK